MSFVDLLMKINEWHRKKFKVKFSGNLLYGKLKNTRQYLFLNCEVLLNLKVLEATMAFWYFREIVLTLVNWILLREFIK